MKSFATFIQEDFNSNGATQFILKVGPKTTPIFYEKLPKRPFNLNRYLKTFENSTANSTLNLNSGPIRGLIFSTETNYLVFIFAGYILHVLIALALKTEKGQYPALDYLKIYNDSYDIDEDEVLSNQWCFPFIYDSR